MTEQSPNDSYFLSYSRSDESIALRFATDLRAQGVDMWVDQLDIRPSEHWDRAIERAVGQCRGIVVILSPRSVISDNVADEISFAIDSRKSVLPVMIERCTLPLRITRMQVIDATRDYGRALQQCLAELSRPAGQAPPGRRPAGEPRPTLDPETVASAKRQLTPILGPIAAIMVDKAAASALSPAELYEVLSSRIDKPADRERFLAAAGRQPVKRAADSAKGADKQSGSGISPAEVDAIGAALTQFLGPIARIVAKREGSVSSSVEELVGRVAQLIPESDRAEFVARVEAR